jgi:hypothetical protein
MNYWRKTPPGGVLRDDRPGIAALAQKTGSVRPANDDFWGKLGKI